MLNFYAMTWLKNYAVQRERNIGFVMITTWKLLIWIRIPMRLFVLLWFKFVPQWLWHRRKRSQLMKIIRIARYKGIYIKVVSNFVGTLPADSIMYLIPNLWVKFSKNREVRNIVTYSSLNHWKYQKSYFYSPQLSNFFLRLVTNLLYRIIKLNLKKIGDDSRI